MVIYITTLILDEEDNEPNTISFSIRPNPVESHSITVSVKAFSEGIRIAIHDISGRMHYNGSLQNDVAEIPVDNLRSGFYFVKVSNELTSTTKMLIVK